MEYKVKDYSEYLASSYQNPLPLDEPDYSRYSTYYRLTSILALLHLYTREYIRSRWLSVVIGLTLYVYRVPELITVVMYTSILLVGRFTLNTTIQLNYQYTNLPYKLIHAEDISEGVSEYSYWMLNMSLVCWAHLQAWLGVWMSLPLYILFLSTLVIYIYNTLIKAAEANAPIEPLSKNKFQ